MQVIHAMTQDLAERESSGGEWFVNGEGSGQADTSHSSCRGKTGCRLTDEVRGVD